MKIKLLILFLFTSILGFSQIDISRDVFAPAGAEFNTSSLSISQTIGETFTATIGATKIVTQGFQQTHYDDKTSIYNLSQENISLYPNPANQQITFQSSIPESFTFNIYDITGRILKTGKNPNGNLVLDLKAYADGKYILEYILESGQNQFISFLKIH